MADADETRYYTSMIELPDDPIGRNLKKSAQKIHLRHFIHRLVYLAVAMQGLRMLYIGIHDILVVYPKIEAYYRLNNLGTESYSKLVGQAVLVSITSFLETAVGLAMLVKKSHTIENMHIIIGIAIFLVSLYFKRLGINLDVEVLEQISSGLRLLKISISG